MKNAREHLTKLASKIPNDAKLLIVWVEKEEKILRLSQVNCNMTDVLNLSESAAIAARQGLNLDKGGK